MILHNLGYPKIGKNREWKKSIENYWAKKINLEQLTDELTQIRIRNLIAQKNFGLDLIPVGDFNCYDHVLNCSMLFGVLPERVEKIVKGNFDLDTAFLIARGKNNRGESTQAGEITKWFDTNYHYIVPELKINQKFALQNFEIFNYISEAKNLKLNCKPVLLGPLSYLYLSKSENEYKLEHLESLLEVYIAFIEKLKDYNIEWLQLDEPILSLDLPAKWLDAIESSYKKLSKLDLKILLTTYFGDSSEHFGLLSQLDVAGIHIDFSSDINSILKFDSLLPKDKVLSAGIIDGRNIWCADLEKIFNALKPIYQSRADNLFLAPSCSLMHCPIDLDLETNLDSEIKGYLSFANQKLSELNTIKQALLGNKNALATIAFNKELLAKKLNSSKIIDLEVREKTKNLYNKNFDRKSGFAKRKAIQKKSLNLPKYPTTTIGSFPQTAENRSYRLQFKLGKISKENYEDKIKEEIKKTIQLQEDIGLDLLVHGEAERNDMVEYFGEQLQGFAFSKMGWVVSYGSRCVKPPIIFGDVKRIKPMTIDWINYARSHAKKEVKGMLTGPVTMLQWSFVRNDIAHNEVAFQLALALNDEVLDLEKAGVKAIQIDEPALREGLPLKKNQQQNYINWAVNSFKLSTLNVKDETQIHTHMCYCEFNEIIEAIAKMDADVLSIESARSIFEILSGLKKHNYPNDIGPGVYDIHSPNVASEDSILNYLKKAQALIPADNLWVNPDCGLKTRNWPEVIESLKNMVSAAKKMRQQNPS